MSYTPFQPVVCRNVAQAEVDKIGARVNYYSGREEEGTVTSHGTVLLRRDTSTVVVGPSEFHPRRRRSHAVAIFVIGGVFDRTRPEIVQFDCDSVWSEGSPCISAFDSETGVQPFQH
jgi:hypothetical protein